MSEDIYRIMSPNFKNNGRWNSIKLLNLDRENLFLICKLAIEHEYLDILHSIVGEYKFDLSIYDNELLLDAVDIYNIDIIKFLLENGCDPEVKHINSNIPLILCIQNIDLLKLFIYHAMKNKSSSESVSDAELDSTLPLVKGDGDRVPSPLVASHVNDQQFTDDIYQKYFDEHQSLADAMLVNTITNGYVFQTQDRDMIKFLLQYTDVSDEMIGSHHPDVGATFVRWRNWKLSQTMVKFAAKCI